MKVVRAFYDRAVYPDGAIVEMTVWRVPSPVAGSRHSLKYSLFYGYPGNRVVGYDNERGKGDHRHIGDREEPYVFSTVEALVADFFLTYGVREANHERNRQSECGLGPGNGAALRRCLASTGAG